LTFPQLLVRFEALPMTPPRNMLRPEGTWGEVFNRAEDDDLTDVPQALRAGFFAREITAAEKAQLIKIYNRKIDYRGEDEEDSVVEVIPDKWLYLSDRNQAMIRIPVTDGNEGPGQRYGGHRAGWTARDQYCGDWVEDVKDTVGWQYRRVGEAEVAAICEKIDNQQGGVFRQMWRFWLDQAGSWSMDKARNRTAELESNLANAYALDLALYEIQADSAELERLKAFIND
jgi:hypothetical protein